MVSFLTEREAVEMRGKLEKENVGDFLPRLCTNRRFCTCVAVVFSADEAQFPYME